MSHPETFLLPDKIQLIPATFNVMKFGHEVAKGRIDHRAQQAHGTSPLTKGNIASSQLFNMSSLNDVWPKVFIGFIAGKHDTLHFRFSTRLYHTFSERKTCRLSIQERLNIIHNTATAQKSHSFFCKNRRFQNHYETIQDYISKDSQVQM